MVLVRQKINKNKNWFKENNKVRVQDRNGRDEWPGYIITMMESHSMSIF